MAENFSPLRGEISYRNLAREQKNFSKRAGKRKELKASLQSQRPAAIYAPQSRCSRRIKERRSGKAAVKNSRYREPKRVLQTDRAESRKGAIMSLTVTPEDWQKEMKEKFPLGSSTVAFICPACKNVATIADFERAGLTSNAAPQQCLFRSTEPERCNWAAYGLFRGPRIILAEDGREVPVFEFAEVNAAAA